MASVTDLLIALRAGEDGSLDRLAQRFLSDCVRLVSQAARRHEIAPIADPADAACDVFLALWLEVRRGSRLAASLTGRQQFSSALSLLALQAAQARRRGERRRRRVIQAGGGDYDGPSLFDRIADHRPPDSERVDDRDALTCLIARLSPREQAIVRELQRDERATNGQIARAIGCSLRAVERDRALLRARRRE